MRRSNPSPKYKIGDLVRIVDELFFADPPDGIGVGDLGIIVNTYPEDPETFSLWGVDYIVFVKGHRILFFETELEPVVKDELKFTYLKK